MSIFKSKKPSITCSNCQKELPLSKFAHRAKYSGPLELKCDVCKSPLSIKNYIEILKFNESRQVPTPSGVIVPLLVLIVLYAFGNKTVAFVGFFMWMGYIIGKEFNAINRRLDKNVTLLNLKNESLEAVSTLNSPLKKTISIFIQFNSQTIAERVEGGGEVSASCIEAIKGSFDVFSLDLKIEVWGKRQVIYYEIVDQGNSTKGRFERSFEITPWVIWVKKLKYVNPSKNVLKNYLEGPLRQGECDADFLFLKFDFRKKMIALSLSKASESGLCVPALGLEGKVICTPWTLSLKRSDLSGFLDQEVSWYPETFVGRNEFHRNQIYWGARFNDHDIKWGKIIDYSIFPDHLLVDLQGYKIAIPMMGDRFYGEMIDLSKTRFFDDVLVCFPREKRLQVVEGEEKEWSSEIWNKW